MLISLKCKSNEDLNYIREFVEILDTNSLVSELSKEGYSESEIYGLLYWILNDSSDNPYMLVQECIHGDDVELNGDVYDPTGRVVLFCIEQDGERTFEVVDSYWKFPQQSKNSMGTNDKNESTVSIVNDDQPSVLLSESELELLKTSLQDGVRQSLFNEVLNQDLTTVLLQMIFSADKNTAEYAFYYIEQEQYALHYEELLNLKDFARENNFCISSKALLEELEQKLKECKCISPGAYTKIIESIPVNDEMDTLKLNALSFSFFNTQNKDDHRKDLLPNTNSLGHAGSHKSNTGIGKTHEADINPGVESRESGPNKKRPLDRDDSDLSNASRSKEEQGDDNNNDARCSLM